MAEYIQPWKKNYCRLEYTYIAHRMKDVGLGSHGRWHFSYWYFNSHSLQEMSLMVVRGVGWNNWSQRFARWRQCWWCNNLHKTDIVLNLIDKKVKSESHKKLCGPCLPSIIRKTSKNSLQQSIWLSLNPPQMNYALSEEINVYTLHVYSPLILTNQ